MINVLSVDVEDYFHVQAFAAQIPCQSWDSFAPRVERNVHRILDLFEEHDAQGTFFVLGWVAQRFPGLVRQIAQAGHEIGCHGFAHQQLHRQTPQQFRMDVRDARERLTDEVQQPVRAYRAPSFSIVPSTLWAFDVLAEEGFAFDSSVFPVKHDLYGIPNAERFPHWRKTSQENRIFEFPPSTIRVAGNNCGVGGGGYLRFAPYHHTRWALRHINEREQQPAMVYFHPWEIDPGQPRIRAGLRSRVRHYTNLSGMEGKLRRLLRDFKFAPLSQVCKGLAAFKSQNIDLKKE
jgi:polysaccharide deacetylase family protein (PEP-CTERM system associated)